MVEIKKLDHKILDLCVSYRQSNSAIQRSKEYLQKPKTTDMNPRLIYLPKFLDLERAEQTLAKLTFDSPWQQEEIWMFGRLVKQPRLTAWYGLGLSAKSRYTKAITATSWTAELLAIKNEVELVLQTNFNSCLVNLYRDGNDRMGLHRDNEACLGQDPIIASLSLGASRRFILRGNPSDDSPTVSNQKRSIVKGKYSQKITFDLHSGDLLVMGKGVQRDWYHEVPASKKVSTPRINLTFRLLADRQRS